MDMEEMYDAQEEREYQRMLEEERKRQWAAEQRAKAEARMVSLEKRIQQLIEQQQSLIETITQKEEEEQQNAEGDTEEEQPVNTRQERPKHNLDLAAHREYMLFCFWCNTEHAICKLGKEGAIDAQLMKQHVYNDVRYLIEYIQKEKPKGFGRAIPDFHIQRRMLENYFGYKYEYDEQQKKWRIFKKQVAMIGETLSK